MFLFWFGKYGGGKAYHYIGVGLASSVLASVHFNRYTSSMKKRIKNLDELALFTREFIISLWQKKEGAVVVTLSGDLGAGKTAFVKEVAKVFGITEDITSPTFVIQKEYDIHEHPFLKKMIHIDAYRLENKSELEYLGWDDIIQNPENIIFMEWPEQVDGIDVSNAISIKIDIVGGEREIEVK